MQGPQAFASTSPPASSKAPIWPSRSIVARTCSEPGVIVNLLLTSSPCAVASLAMDAERDMSSYEELVQEPMSATLSSWGQLFFFTSSANLEIGVARSGVKGPLMWGSSSDKFYTVLLGI